MEVRQEEEPRPQIEPGGPGERDAVMRTPNAFADVGQTAEEGTPERNGQACEVEQADA